MKPGDIVQIVYDTGFYPPKHPNPNIQQHYLTTAAFVHNNLVSLNGLIATVIREGAAENTEVKIFDTMVSDNQQLYFAVPTKFLKVVEQ